MAQQVLPTVSRDTDLLPALKVWQRTLGVGVKSVKVPTIPFNFAAQGKVGGVQLSWAKSSDATGYELTWSESSDLSSAPSISISGGNQTTFFDSIGASGVTRFYKLRAVNSNGKKTARSAYTGLVSSTSQPTPAYVAPISRDIQTTDASQVGKGIFL